MVCAGSEKNNTFDRLCIVATPATKFIVAASRLVTVARDERLNARQDDIDARDGLANLLSLSSHVKHVVACSLMSLRFQSARSMVISLLLIDGE